MVTLMAIYRIVPGAELVFLPVWLLLLLFMALGIGFFSSAVMVTYRDLTYVIPVLLQFLLYASPVGYSIDAVPEGLRPIIYANPISGLMEGFRWSLLDQGRIDPMAIGYSAIAAFIVFIFGLFVFRKLERRFADVI